MSQETASSADAEQKVARYSPTPYADMSWAVVAQGVEMHEFTPLSVAVLQSEQNLVDPLFADYSREAPPSFGSPAPDASSVGGQDGSRGIQDSSQDTSAPDVSVAGLEGAVSDSFAQEAFVGIDPAEHEREVIAAREEGREEGRTSAAAEAAEQLREVQGRLAGTLEDLRSQIEETLALTERRAVELALHIARKLVGVAVETSPDYITPILREAIRAAGSAHVRKIRVSPRDYDFLKNVRIEGSDGAGLEFESDETVHAGCIVVTSAGEVDFNLDDAWERIRSLILARPGEKDG